MTNPKRGELEITLGEKKFNGRVTLDVVMRIERQMGKGIVKIAQSLSEAEFTVEQMVGILTPVIRAGGNDVKEPDIKEALWEAGLVSGIQACSEVIASVLGVDEQDEGNVAEAEQLL